MCRYQDVDPFITSTIIHSKIQYFNFTIDNSWNMTPGDIQSSYQEEEYIQAETLGKLSKLTNQTQTN